MSRLLSRNGAAKPFTAWTTVFYLLLVFIAPLAFFGTAHAEEDSVQENYGTGMSWILFFRNHEVLVLNRAVHSHRYRSWNNILLCRCDAERKG